MLLILNLLTGLSMGGWGAWNLALLIQMFAALVPIMVVDVTMIENCKIATIPIKFSRFSG
jgi:predicted peptidase